MFFITELLLNLQARFNIFDLLLHPVIFSLCRVQFYAISLFLCVMTCDVMCACVKWPSVRLLGRERHKAETGAIG